MDRKTQLYVLVNEPLTLRRDIVKGALLSAIMIKRLNSINEIKEKKRILENEIVGRLKETDKMLKDLNQVLPIVRKKEDRVELKEEIKEKVIEGSDDIERLSNELEYVESKLNSLQI